MSAQFAADAELEDAERVFHEGLKGFITAAAASVNAATTLQKDAKVLYELLAKERLRLKDQRLRLEADRASLGSPVSQLGATSQAPDSARARAFERELGHLRLGGDGVQAWEPLAEAFQATANAFKPISAFRPISPDAIEAELPRPASTEEPDPAYYEDFNNAVRIGLRSYTVLPPHSKHSTKPSHSMCNQTVTVPDGWEILSTGMEDFQQVIQELSHNGWGTLRLCVRDADTDGFASYSTPLRHFGAPGEKLSDNTKIVIPDPENPRKFTFDSAKVSARLVIRSNRLWHGWR